MAKDDDSSLMAALAFGLFVGCAGSAVASRRIEGVECGMLF
jgi:hypothetical protein